MKNNFPHCTVRKIDLERCQYEVDICDNVMQCPCCCYFVDKRNTLIAEDIVNNLTSIPEKITLIRIPILPTPDNKPYYSFNGIETIVYNLFKTTNKKFKKSLEKGDAYLKVYYKNDPLFTLPIIVLEIFFLEPLHEKAVDELWKTLKAEVLFFTGSVGDIESIYLSDAEELIKLLHTPLLVGQEEFRKEGVLLKHDFSEEQIMEMNYIHSISVSKLDMKSVINNNLLSLFEDQKTSIENELIQKSDEVEMVINAMFAKEDRDRNDDEVDELPF